MVCGETSGSELRGMGGSLGRRQESKEQISAGRYDGGKITDQFLFLANSGGSGV